MNIEEHHDIIQNKDTFIPIFIIVHDRFTDLKKAVESFKKISTPIKIIFHDVASTFEPCLRYLEEMKNAGHDVYRTETNHHLTVMKTVEKYLQLHEECEYFVLTDPDVELDDVNGDILEFYEYISKQNNNKYVVGPMLRIDDIPDYYPYKQTAISSHTRQFWHKTPTLIKYKNNEYKIQCSPIDTTFQLVHKSLISSRFPHQGFRCYAPYSARHLDWYIDPKKMTDDQIFYSNNASKNISHWGVSISNK